MIPVPPTIPPSILRIETKRPTAEAGLDHRRRLLAAVDIQ